VLSLPQFETTPEAIKATADKTIAVGNVLLDAVRRLPAGGVILDNTLGAQASQDLGKWRFCRLFAKPATRRLPENTSKIPHLAYSQLAARHGFEP
jgi:hypothetical protein